MEMKKRNKTNPHISFAFPYFLLFLFALFAASFVFAQEKHLTNIRQLTFGGENAEAYFSADGKQLSLQSTRDNDRCDQIYSMNSDGTGLRRLSPGTGRTTCSYFYRDGSRILYSSTHAASPECPPGPDRSKGYTWAVYPTYDIYTAKPDGTDLKLLYSSPGYDAEATISPDGKSIVFTSDHEGDLELYTMNIDGSNVKRLTHFPGYDGGAFFSPDSRWVVFRGNHITDPAELREYQELLKQHLVRPTKLEIYIMPAEGGEARQVTHNGAANFCPYFHPDGKRIIFASNMGDPKGRNFDLYLINTAGTGLEQITFEPTFDGFPMFSPDGTQLVFASNRNGKVQGETNIFLADWVDNPPDISAEALRKHVYYLASDEMKGRLTGTPEARKAAEYIEAEFQKYGLLNPPGQQSAYQQFEFTSGVKLGQDNALAAADRNYTVANDFIPSGFSEDATLNNIPAVFAGFGMQAHDQKYDDYAGLDVKGKAVFIYRYGPEGDDPKSAYAQYYPVRYKAMTAREQGAAALLVVSQEEDDDELPKLRTDASFGTSGIPVLFVKRSVAANLLKAAGKSLPDWKNPHSGAQTFDLPGLALTLHCNLVREKGHSDNVLGWLPAATASDQTLVIGAHYDHLGLGMEGSLAPKWGEVHNGADDNASGVAGILELARVFSTQREHLKRNILFIAFGGEELGTLGSGYFVKNAVLPLKNIAAMINLDMIGRLRDHKVVIGGAGTSSAWKDLLTARGDLKLTLNEDGYGPSDHSVFYAKDIPVLFFFTGAHSEYHRPEDDPNTLNYEGMVDVLHYVDRLAYEIDVAEKMPEFTRAKAGAQEMAGRGFRVYVGTIPDYTEEVKGVKLTGVREGSPAEKAGLRAGDIIIKFGNKQVENIYDYTYALQDHKPGDAVTIVVLRDGKELPLEATLERRPSE